ncbi:DUF5074 domain-containing protein [Parabacteroides sp. PF5-6]|uniref:DUF5074 domain-containing protein n=1 Tax=Parabacteroides sp. PF5-6 TaxID=1742403 RepID=UPI00240706E6|nr:DUF5074 domain-containing protein [Parabacteroides sp. PF5-6]MDF9829961.1 YVTN family beta-propeller protein [Parabacteroides sp. PF5-6]
MKKFILGLVACTLMSVSFSSCEDDDEKIVIPSEVVTNLSFTDTDMDPYKIGGTLSWELPASEENVTGYVVYLSETTTEKATQLGEVAAGVKSFIVPAGTDLNSYLLVVAKNVVGESEQVASIAVKDNSGDPIVTELKFTDTDNAFLKIGGTLSWTLPNPEGYATGYVIYGSDDNTKKGTKIGEVEAGISSFDIPEGTAYYAFLQVISRTAAGESENISSVAVKDNFIGTLLILNGGNFNENNASIASYDLETGVLTPNFYLTANGSGLGDSAEQILVYGTKIYVTVTTSNRLVVLERDGKLIKSIEPKDGDAPLNPRGMVADNGKVYVSYYYGHAVAVLDTASLAVEEVIPVGRYPEQLAVSKGKIYVANSGGLDYPNYGTTVSVIDQTSLEVEKEIEVLLNPTALQSDSRGDIYLISMGNYGDVKNTLQRIDATTGEVTVMGNASRMTLVNDKLYTAFAQWGDPNITFKVYDALTEAVANENFITDGTSITNPYALAVDPTTGDIYVAESAWGSTGSLYIFSADGKLQGSPIDTQGYETKCMTFLLN